MAEKKKGKKRKEEYVAPGEESVEKPSKEEYALAKWLRKNVPIKKTKFLNHNVEYFTASKALDALMASQYHTGANPLFSSRQDAIDYLDVMLRHKFFHRARKVPVTEQELKGRKKEKKSQEGEEKKKEEKGTDAESSHVEGKQETAVEKEKRKRKVRLEMHNDQIFADCLDAFVWIYDPIPVYYWFFGTLLVLGAIGICVFPLWPPPVRKGVYYISVAAAGFLVFIIALAIIRAVVFSLVWLLTFGDHHIWLLPNLTEDVSFFASFWPLYHYEYKGGKKSDEKKKKKKDKDSDAENEDDIETLERESPKHEKRKLSQESTTPDEKESESGRQLQDGTQSERQEGQSHASAETGGEEGGSESESESSQRSSTGRDFEMVNEDELAESS